ncbi:exodeoxyribonuclease III [Breoghania sp.]|uniref:exodeoxyribonuclease III n=1 Tax=Breoghania sp. TaxID=2065378 RepID=UPI00262ABD56|nr:exodeoxyribonuclease III [Breoghania sp.]MDJ0931659.1 exodeoxyribonuclease III [Breoghania sp.]
MTDRLTIATWNINSVRLRLPIVERFLKTYQPGVLCLQETKCPDGNFPFAPLRKAGYQNIEISGQKGYHGVATISKRPLTETERRKFCDNSDCRHIATDVPFCGRHLRIHNFYVPAGGDELDPHINDKFKHKLDFLDEMEDWLGATTFPCMVVGDLNIAPYEQDVWSTKQLSRVVSHTPLERERLEDVRKAGPFVDAMRCFVPMEEKLYTWWSYRAKDWEAANKGRRLDHVWVTPPLAPKVVNVEVVREARGWDCPSDHAPVLATLEG